MLRESHWFDAIRFCAIIVSILVSHFIVISYLEFLLQCLYFKQVVSVVGWLEHWFLFFYPGLKHNNMSIIKNDIWPLKNGDLCFLFVAIAQTGYFGGKLPPVFSNQYYCSTKPAFQVWSEVGSGFQNACLHHVDLFLSARGIVSFSKHRPCLGSYWPSLRSKDFESNLPLKWTSWGDALPIAWRVAQRS